MCCRTTKTGGIFTSLFGNLQVTVNKVLTIDYVISMTLSGVALFTLSLPAASVDDEDKDPSEKVIPRLGIRSNLFELARHFIDSFHKSTKK